MTRLSQTIAVEGEVSSSYERFLVEAKRGLALEGLLSGFDRSYKRKDDDDEQLPAETKRVQVRADRVLREVADQLTKWLDITATRDWANQEAKADLTVDGQKLITGAPVSYLLWLEKRLDDLEKLVRQLPILDQAEHWDRDDQAGLWKTEAVETVAKRKVPQVLRKAPATKEHPEQTEVWYDDVPKGTWSLVKFSGAMPEPEIRKILDRLVRLRIAAKAAREEANIMQVTEQKVGDALLKFILG